MCGLVRKNTPASPRSGSINETYNFYLLTELELGVAEKNKFLRYSFMKPLLNLKMCLAFALSENRYTSPFLDPNYYVRNFKFKLGYFIRLCEHLAVTYCNE